MCVYGVVGGVVDGIAEGVMGVQKLVLAILAVLFTSSVV